MVLSLADIEGCAIDHYRELGFEPDRPVDTFRQVRKKLGPRGLERRTGLVGIYGRTFRINDETRIAVNSKLAIPYQQFYAGHELGHIYFRERGHISDDIERDCDMFGAAVMAPLPAVRSMLRVFGRDHEAIADEVGSTQTWAALRIAEALGMARVVVTPAKVYARGPEEFVWGTEADVRRLVKGRCPGIVRAKLTDDPRRMVIDVEEAC